MWQDILHFLESMGIVQFFSGDGWKNLVMIIISLILLYLAIFKKAEPYLLIPIAFGMLLVNLPGSDVFVKTMTTFTAQGFADFLGISSTTAEEIFSAAFANSGIEVTESANLEMLVSYLKSLSDGGTSLYGLTESQIYTYTNATLYEYTGLIGFLYQGVKLGIYPCLIFLGIGATTDFGPLIANPKSMLLGAAAQLGIFVAFLLAIAFGFTGPEAAAIGIIGGADGPTAILSSTRLAENLLPAISIAAYSYMALVPFIQKPIIRLLTTKKERQIKMTQLREVSKIEKILFPIIVTLVVVLLVPSCAPLIGMLMFGNLIKESGVVPHLVHTAGNALLYIVTILLGVSVGATATGATFLQVQTLFILILGCFAFAIATAGGVLSGKIMCLATHGKVNPMIGAAGVSAVPMSARVVQAEGQREDPTNFLLMHAMGPNVAGVIGSAVAAGIMLSFFG